MGQAEKLVKSGRGGYHGWSADIKLHAITVCYVSLKVSRAAIMW